MTEQSIRFRRAPTARPLPAALLLLSSAAAFGDPPRSAIVEKSSNVRFGAEVVTNHRDAKVRSDDGQGTMKVRVGERVAEGFTGNARVDVAFLGNGECIAIAGRTIQGVEVWDSTTGKRLYTLKIDEPFLQTLAASHDGSTLAASYSRNNTYVWTMNAKPTAFRLPRPEGETAGRVTMLSDDGGLLTTFTTNERQIFAVWDLATKKQFGSVAAYALTEGLHLTHDGRHGISEISEGGSTRLAMWSMPDGKEVWRISPEAGVTSIATSPTENIAVVGVGNRDPVRFLDLHGGEWLQVARGLERSVFALCYSVDGRFVASSNMDRTVRIWEVASATELIKLDLGYIPPNVAFSPDCRHVATGGRDGTATIWTLPPREESKKSKLTADELLGQLHAPQARDAYAALYELERTPEAAIAAIMRHLQRDPAPALRRLFEQLDSDDFQSRERASAELQGFGAAQLPAFKREFATTDSAEVRMRLKEIISSIERDDATPRDVLFRGRVIDLLERIATPAAEACLRQLTKDANYQASHQRMIDAALSRLASLRAEASDISWRNAPFERQ